MVEPLWESTQVVGGRDNEVCPTIPIGGQSLFGRRFLSAGMWKPELLKDAPVVFFAFISLLFTGVIVGRVITEMHEERGLRTEIKERLLSISR
jgi:hypothetical protein